MSSKNRGFTLIEVMGILILLALIATIIIPSVMQTITHSKENSIKMNTKILVKASQDYYVEQLLLNNDIEKISLTDDTLIYDGDRPDMGFAIFDGQGRAYIHMYQSGYCVISDYDGKITLTKTLPSECTVDDMAAITLYLANGVVTASDDWSNGEGFISIILPIGEQIYKIPTIERMGCTFKGWYTAEGELIDLSKPVLEHITATAKWEGNPYTVTLNLVGGTIDGEYEASRVVYYEEPYGELPTPTKYGYTFDGWYTSSGTLVTESTVLKNASNHTLYAGWEPITYNLVLDADGGSLPSSIGWTITDDIGTKSVILGTKYDRLLTPFKEGYTFLGWYDSGNNLVDGNIEVTGPLTLTAKWSANKYTITFESNGGTTVESIEVTYDTKYEILPSPTKEGYKFDGWYTSSDVLITNDDLVKIIRNTTLYAKWD